MTLEALATPDPWDLLQAYGLGRAPPPSPGQAQLWLFRLDAAPARLDARLRLLDAEEASRAARFRFERDRTAFVASHAMLRTILGAMLDRPPAQVSIVRQPGGKPMLADTTGLEFNLSHSGEVGLVGVSPSRIGVDVETVRPIPERDLIARRNFAPSEAASLEALPEAEREGAFFACWTCKEAVVKALGYGLIMPLDRFEVSVAPGAAPALLSLEGAPKASSAWSLWSGRVMSSAWAAAAVEGPGVAFTVLEAKAPAARYNNGPSV